MLEGSNLLEWLQRLVDVDDLGRRVELRIERKRLTGSFERAYRKASFWSRARAHALGLVPSWTRFYLGEGGRVALACALLGLGGGTAAVASAPGASQCRSDLLLCDKLCFDSQADPAHCGSCYTQCGDGQSCADSKCVMADYAVIDDCASPLSKCV